MMDIFIWFYFSFQPFCPLRPAPSTNCRPFRNDDDDDDDWAPLNGRDPNSPACRSVVSRTKKKQQKSLNCFEFVLSLLAYRCTACLLLLLCISSVSSQWVCGFEVHRGNFLLILFYYGVRILPAHAYYIPVIGNRLAICLALFCRCTHPSLSLSLSFRPHYIPMNR